jgi:hypothetical protein
VLKHQSQPIYLSVSARPLPQRFTLFSSPMMVS